MLINIENLSKIYKTKELETLALNNINLQIDNGEFLSVMGPSGCGKSTLLHILGMIDSPTSGRYFFSDMDVSSISESERSSLRKSKIGFVFQNFNLLDSLTIAENIDFALINTGISGAKRQKRVNAVLRQMNISHRKNHFPSQLSGGQQQRAAVARAIASMPDLILADEPTGNLDSDNGDEVMEIFKNLNRDGAAIIMVTHSISSSLYSSRTVKLFDGAIIEKNKEANYA